MPWLLGTGHFLRCVLRLFILSPIEIKRVLRKTDQMGSKWSNIEQMMTNTLKRLSRIDLKLLQEKRDESYCKTKVLCIENKGGNKGQWYSLMKVENVPKNSHQFKVSTAKKCRYLKFFWSVFSPIWTEYGEIRRISPFEILMRKNMDQKHSEYGHFLDSDKPVFSRVRVKL